MPVFLDMPDNHTRARKKASPTLYHEERSLRETKGHGGMPLPASAEALISSCVPSACGGRHVVGDAEDTTHSSAITTGLSGPRRRPSRPRRHLIRSPHLALPQGTDSITRCYFYTRTRWPL